MTITINGSGTIGGVTAGGLPSGTVTKPVVATGVGGTGPAFSAGCTSGTTVSNATFTKMPFQYVDFDTAGCYNNTTYRFTPTVAGYYNVIGRQQWTSSAGASENFIAVYKNGAEVKRGWGTAWNIGIEALIYLNGSSDYIELYCYQASGGSVSLNGASSVYSTFAAFLARSA